VELRQILARDGEREQPRERELQRRVTDRKD
jgi:hypothetical protein